MDIKLGFIILEYSDFQLNIIIIKYEVKSHPAHIFLLLIDFQQLPSSSL